MQLRIDSSNNAKLEAPAQGNLYFKLEEYGAGGNHTWCMGKKKVLRSTSVLVWSVTQRLCSTHNISNAKMQVTREFMTLLGILNDSEVGGSVACFVRFARLRV